MGKKSYNPFKMWGSYVGLLAFLILIIFANVCTPRLQFIESNYIGNCDESVNKIIFDSMSIPLYLIGLPLEFIIKEISGVEYLGGDFGLDWVQITNLHILYIILQGLIFITIGFIIGWIIHSFIRTSTQTNIFKSKAWWISGVIGLILMLFSLLILIFGFTSTMKSIWVLPLILFTFLPIFLGGLSWSIGVLNKNSSFKIIFKTMGVLFYISSIVLIGTIVLSILVSGLG